MDRWGGNLVSCAKLLKKERGSHLREKGIKERVICKQFKDNFDLKYEHERRSRIIKRG